MKIYYFEMKHEHLIYHVYTEYVVIAESAKEAWSISGLDKDKFYIDRKSELKKGVIYQYFRAG